MLERLADGCAKREFDSANPSAVNMPLSASEQESVSKWRSVGSSGNGEACKAMIDNAENGCSYNSYWESDAIVACQ